MTKIYTILTQKHPTILVQAQPVQTFRHYTPIHIDHIVENFEKIDLLFNQGK